MRRLARTRPLLAARARLVRGAGLVIALLLAGHALARFLVSQNKTGGEWAYLAISLAIAVAVVLSAERIATSARRERPKRR